MALLAGTALFLIRNVIRQLSRPTHALSIARTVMTWHIDEVVHELSINNIEFDPRVADRIRRQNSRYTSKDFFELLGFVECQDIDIDPTEGCSIVHDLNTPLPAEHEGRFDFVLENGTIEHIFDIKTAMANIAKAVRVGGIVCHVSPLDAFNHGFYNFSINLFNDFYRANGFEDREFYLMRYAADWRKDQTVLVERIPYTHEEFFVNKAVYDSAHNKLAIGFVGKKSWQMKDIVTPMQAAYDPSLRLSSALKRW